MLSPDIVVAPAGNQGLSALVSAPDKILPLAELAKVAASLRKAGKRVVQCHGTFDLLHVGHVRHLKTARQYGDALFVTITADRFVNKGPGRPVFSEALRAEMLAQLSLVDWVGIVHDYDAVPAIEALRPAFYVKGHDYQNPEGDVTGKIVAEREIAESFGGQLVFTDELVFSSSQLINRHLNVYEPHLRSYLDGMRRNGEADQIGHLLDQIGRYRILIVGETIVDEYRYVVPMAKPPKENIIATRLQDLEVFSGGVIATANHAANFCAEVEVITVLGASDSHEHQIRKALKPNVKLTPIYRDGAPTIRKVRYVDRVLTRKLFEVYEIDDTPLPSALERDLAQLIEKRAAEFDVVIANDFGHGMIQMASVDALVKNAKFLAVNTQTNSANMGFNLITKYHRADLVCLDALEARLASRQRDGELTDVINRLLPSVIDCDKFMITHGPNGCLVFERGGHVTTIPAFSPSVRDTMGAGDAFLAVAAPLAAAGAPIELAGFVGNVVGARKVEIVGHRSPVEKSEVLRGITSLLK